MNQDQKDKLKHYTCCAIERLETIEEELKDAGIPLVHRKKFSKAINMIAELNVISQM